MIAGFIGRALHEFTLAGVNHSIPGNGGHDCVNFLPHWQKIVETAFFVPLSLYAVYVTISHLEYPNKTKENGSEITAEVRERLASSLPVNKIPGAGTVELPHRRYVFNFYAIIFFIELIYKTITRTGIFFF
ncbi:hypothetical protein M3Y98_01060900 [Aphelenchoides besseyi]|nr:hypothetical protein M3Y98_01060900 [Aphelenchoides besseyi]